MDFCVEQQPEGGLLQSLHWMDVLRDEGITVITVDDHATSPCHAIVQPLWGIGPYAYVPRVATMTDQLARALAALPYAWVRFDAADAAAVHKCAQASQKRVYAAPHDMQPRHNLIVDIRPHTDTLLAAMKPKTRYNIRLAEKRGVCVRPTQSLADYDAFFALVDATALRKGVHFHDHAHYRAILTQLPRDMVTLYGAFYRDVMIAGSIVTFYNGTATYLHGATSDRHRDVMAPFALQWRAIRDARNRQCAWYDFGGVFPHTQDPGRQGITRFKMGFAPRAPLHVTAGSHDIVRSPLRYAAYRAGQKIKHYFT